MAPEPTPGGGLLCQHLRLQLCRHLAHGLGAQAANGAARVLASAAPQTLPVGVRARTRHGQVVLVQAGRVQVNSPMGGMYDTHGYLDAVHTTL